MSAPGPRRRLAPLLVLCLCLAGAPAGAGEGEDAPGFLGFHLEPLSILTDAQRAEIGTTQTRGNVVAALIQGGPADRAGLKLGDLVVRFAGRDLPVLETTNRYDPVHHEWRVTMREVFGAVRLGHDVEVVSVRDGERCIRPLQPVDTATMHRMQGGNDVRVPPPTEAGEPRRMQLLFEEPGTARGPLPPGFVPDEGHWHLQAHDAAASGHGVLTQDMTVVPWAALVAAGSGRSFADGHAQVRFKPRSGVTDASGGILWRAQDGRNYYLARANALEDNFRIYIMRDGVRTELASAIVTLPAFNEWHVIDVWFEGPVFRATLNGRNLVEARDETFATGYCGLWTKADSVTMFDDLEVTPKPARP